MKKLTMLIVISLVTLVLLGVADYLRKVAAVSIGAPGYSGKSTGRAESQSLKQESAIGISTNSEIPGKIVYIRDGNVWIAKADGTNQQKLTTSGDCGEPNLSPDGTKIAYIRYWEYGKDPDYILKKLESGAYPKSGYIWCYDLSTKTASRVFPEPEYGCPKWSAKGDWLAFLRYLPVCSQGSMANLEIFSLVNKGRKTLLKEVWNCSPPTWSPTGEGIYYSHCGGHYSEETGLEIAFRELSNPSHSQIIYEKRNVSDEDYVVPFQFIDKKTLAFYESNPEGCESEEQWHLTTILDLETREFKRFNLSDVCFLGDPEKYWDVDVEYAQYPETEDIWTMRLVVNGEIINEIEGGKEVSWIPG